jgi:hypothetical protein
MTRRARHFRRHDVGERPVPHDDAMETVLAAESFVVTSYEGPSPPTL